MLKIYNGNAKYIYYSHVSDISFVLCTLIILNDNQRTCLHVIYYTFSCYVALQNLYKYILIS